jgi:hypothetical protein
VVPSFPQVSLALAQAVLENIKEHQLLCRDLKREQEPLQEGRVEAPTIPLEGVSRPTRPSEPSPRPPHAIVPRSLRLRFLQDGVWFGVCARCVGNKGAVLRCLSLGGQALEERRVRTPHFQMAQAERKEALG